MKKDIEWLKESIYGEIDYVKDKLPKMNRNKSDGRKEWHEGYLAAIKEVRSKINQLDELEVLSQEWIDENTYYVHDRESSMVYAIDLQNLLVPKQELPVIPNYVSKWISVHHEQFDLYPALKRLENNALSWEDVYEWYRRNTHTFVKAYLSGKYEVEEEQKYYVVKSKGLDGVYYYFTKFDDEVHGLFGLPNDKEVAYKFDDKEKAQAIANYTNSEVEEVEE